MASEKNAIVFYMAKKEAMSLAFTSILFKTLKTFQTNGKLEMPDFFHDLNIDQIVNSLVGIKGEYNLREFFYIIPTDVEEIKYRQEIMKDLEKKDIFSVIDEFAMKMRKSRLYKSYSDKLTLNYQKERWFVDAVDVYVKAIKELLERLENVDLKSQGLIQFREYLESYVNSNKFMELFSQTQEVLSKLLRIKYTLLIKENKVKVQKYNGEKDYASEVLKTFERFKQGAVKDYTVEFDESMDMNGVEEKVLDLVAKLYEEEFSDLERFYGVNASYIDKTISRFDREIQFYVTYLEYIEPLKKDGLDFCYPEFTTSKEIYAKDAFDLALAFKLHREGLKVVSNDFYLNDPERIIVVTGPNQGGKTTFARMFGQVHYLAKMGYPIPASEARLFLFDNIFTHFEKEEKIGNLRGKLEDDLIRIRNILDKASKDSIIIMNEIFSSTTLEDAKFLAKKVMEEIMKKDSIALLVTFMYELSELNEKTVSMVSTVSETNPEMRTYKILRRPSNGLSYAVSLAKKYGLTYEQLKKRVKDESFSDVRR